MAQILAHIPWVLSLPRGFCRYTSAHADCPRRFTHRGPLDRPHDRRETRSLRITRCWCAMARILDILPSAVAAERYSATAVLQRNSHLLMPGMINVHPTAAALLLARRQWRAAALESTGQSGFRARQHPGGDRRNARCPESPASATAAISPKKRRARQMNRACARCSGCRSPIAPTPWAKDAAQSLTRALRAARQAQGRSADIHRLRTARGRTA